MIGNKADQGHPYHGTLVFTNNTLSFKGTTIQLKNVTRFITYEVEPFHVIPTVLLIICSLIFLLSFSWKGMLFITIITGLIAAYGIKEYFQPKFYAIKIELTSSSQYTFSSVDKEGILEVRRRLDAAMTSDKPINTTVTFNSDKIIFGDHVARDKYEVNNSKIESLGAFNNNPGPKA